MGVALTTWEVMDDRAHMLRVLGEVFAEVGSDDALVGGIAVGYHGRLRATVDVDVLVPRRKMARIVKALEARGFSVTRHEGMRRVFAPGAAPDRDDGCRAARWLLSSFTLLSLPLAPSAIDTRTSRTSIA